MLILCVGILIRIEIYDIWILYAGYTIKYSPVCTQFINSTNLAGNPSTLIANSSPSNTPTKIFPFHFRLPYVAAVCMKYVRLDLYVISILGVGN